MENNYQTMENVQPTYQAPPVQPVTPVYNQAPQTSVRYKKMPAMVSFLMKVTAFFIPVLGFILGCLVNLTPYENREKISNSILKLSAAMFVITLILLAIGAVVGIVVAILTLVQSPGAMDAPVMMGEVMSEVAGCIF